MILDEIDHAALAQAFDAIAEYGQYRNYKLFSTKQLAELRLKYLITCLEVTGSHSASIFIENAFSGYCIYSPLLWDSIHFGVKMGRLECGFSKSVTNKLAAELVKSVMTRAIKEGAVHVSASVDTENCFLTNTLSRAGFDVLDTRLNYIARRRARPRDEGRICVRAYEADDYSAVSDIVSSLYFPSRFSRDSTLSSQKTNEMYLRWIERLHSAKDDGVLIVACRQNQVVAFAGISPVRLDLPGTEKVLLGNSLSASSRNGIGSAYSMVGRGINEGLKRCSAIEFSASINNLPIIRVLEAHGCTVAGSSHALRWCSPA